MFGRYKKYEEEEKKRIEMLNGKIKFGNLILSILIPLFVVGCVWSFFILI